MHTRLFKVFWQDVGEYQSARHRRLSRRAIIEQLIRHLRPEALKFRVVIQGLAIAWTWNRDGDRFAESRTGSRCERDDA
jgi:hypothetical protein